MTRIYDLQDIMISALQIPEVTDRETVDQLKQSMSGPGGLLHAITVKHDLTIHAGKRRAQAAKELGWTNVHCKVLPESITPEQLEEIEIQENLARRNLPWHQEVTLRKRLLDMRQAELGKPKQGKKVGFSLRDLAAELNEGLGTLSQDIRLAEAVLADPNLRKIEDKTTAQRLVFHKAKRIQKEDEAAMPVTFETDVVYCGDSAAILAQLPDNIFDVCFTDPPWLEFKDKSLIKDASTLPVFEQVYRTLKNDAFMYVICSTPDFYTYLSELAKIGFRCMHMPLIWHKSGIISHGLRPWEYMRNYEPILLAVKGNPVLTQSTAPGAVYASAAIHQSRAIHPNEKPVDVPAHFLEHSSYEGSIVLDPFGGSGVTGEACIKSGRRYVIIERNKEYANGIEQRLAKVPRGQVTLQERNDVD